MEQVAVMQNIFYNQRISKTFDLKGSLRGWFAAQIQRAKDDSQLDASISSVDRQAIGLKRRTSEGLSETSISSPVEENDGDTSYETQPGPATLLDGDFLAFTYGRPLPLTDRAKSVFQMSILNVSSNDVNCVCSSKN